MTEVEINSRAPSRHLWLFKEPEPLNSIGYLHDVTLRLLRDERWDTLHIVAETGEWIVQREFYGAITKQAERGRKLTIEMIVVKDAAPLAFEARQLHESLAKLPRDSEHEVYELPWWMHNRHLTLLQDGGKLVAGIYFRRRLKTALIHPVLLRNVDDLRTLEGIFERYREKCERYRREGQLLEP